MQEQSIPTLDHRYRWYKIELTDEFLKPCTYYFRGLTVRELRISGSKLTTFDAESYILETLVLPQKPWDTMVAGTPLKILKEIYKYSGLTEEGLNFAEAIDWIHSEQGAMEAAAVVMIPSCTPNELETCDPFHYAKYLTVAKLQFESLYGRSIEEAFLGKPPEGNDLDFTPNPGLPATPGPGQIGQQIEDQFTWRRT